MMQGMQPPRRMRFSWESRCRFARLVKEQGLTPEQAAVACGAHRSTGYRWLARFEEAGWDGLVDRSSVPRRQPRRVALGGGGGGPAGGRGAVGGGRAGGGA